MVAVIQRVVKGKVSINERPTVQIKQGYVILLGIDKLDTIRDAQWMSAKIVNIRLFDDQQGKINLSLTDVQGDILLISQFTLLANCKKGNRPAFSEAALPGQAMPLYQNMINLLETKLDKKIYTGEFGAEMMVEIHNSGPVTIILDSQKNRGTNT